MRSGACVLLFGCVCKGCSGGAKGSCKLSRKKTKNN